MDVVVSQWGTTVSVRVDNNPCFPTVREEICVIVALACSDYVARAWSRFLALEILYFDIAVQEKPGKHTSVTEEIIYSLLHNRMQGRNNGMLRSPSPSSSEPLKNEIDITNGPCRTAPSTMYNFERCHWRLVVKWLQMDNPLA